MSNQSCPCGSGSELSACCLPMIQGKKKAKTAEDLLRSRYTAFTRGDVDYILETHHGKTRKDVSREEIADWSKNSEWLGLKIVQQEAGTEKDEQGTIVFCATYKSPGEAGEAKTEEHWEQSYFEKENGEWRFLDAKGIQTGPYRRAEPKTGRNDPCPCGSGKKFKKCHGTA
ncbi:MAG: YchJ family protein [Bdellovibrionota bacterium]